MISIFSYLIQLYILILMLVSILTCLLFWFTLPFLFISFHAGMRLMYDLDILLFYCTTLVVAYSEELDKGVKRLIAQGLNR